VFTGTGNVSQGAQELFKHLPHEFVDPSTLPKVAKKGGKLIFVLILDFNFL
jgi:alpha-aminoadipic semialdehyde synthase